MVRRGKAKHAKRLVKYLEGVHKVTGRNAKFDGGSALKSIQVALNNAKEHAVWFVEIDGEVKGILVGISNSIWYSKKREVLDLVFYIDEDARGHGAWMVRKFLRWAGEVPGVAEIYLSETYGHSERTHQLYTNMGMEHVGHIYKITV